MTSKMKFPEINEEKIKRYLSQNIDIKPFVKSVCLYLTDEGRESVPFLQLDFCHFDHENVV